MAVGAALAFTGCSDDEPAASAGGGTAHGGAAHGGGPSGGASGNAADGAVTCEVIGELCHEADTGSGAGHECHELGHQGHVEACESGFSDCVALCVDDDEGAGGAKPDAHCAALGELCHPVDDGNGPLHECHEVGHVGNAAKCAAEFDDCATLCLAAREELEAGEGGGAGGAGGSESSLGGAGATASGGAR